MTWVLAVFFFLLLIGVPIGFPFSASPAFSAFSRSAAPRCWRWRRSAILPDLDPSTFSRPCRSLSCRRNHELAPALRRAWASSPTLVGHLRGGMAQSCMVSSVLYNHPEDSCHSNWKICIL